MRTLFILFLSIYLNNTVNAGVNDYFVYDRGDRYQLEKLDGIVSAKVIGYYAFADSGLVTTVVEERKKSAGKEILNRDLSSIQFSSTKGTECLFEADPVQNSILQLLRNSLWIIDVEITEVLDGSIEKTRGFVAMKRTRAFMFYEHPTKILADPSSNLLLGLIQVDKEFFRKDYRGFMCYLENNLNVLDAQNTENLSNRSLIDYDSISRSAKPTKFYVAREVGTTQRYTVKNGQIQTYQEDSKLMQALKKKQKSAHKKSL